MSVSSRKNESRNDLIVQYIKCAQDIMHTENDYFRLYFINPEDHLM
jgi:hypothetical protein